MMRIRIQNIDSIVIPVKSPYKVVFIGLSPENSFSATLDKWSDVSCDWHTETISPDMPLGSNRCNKRTYISNVRSGLIWPLISSGRGCGVAEANHTKISVYD